MKMWRKILAISLVITMSMLLVACGTKAATNETTGATDTSKTTTEATPAATAEATPTAEAQKQDITISFMASQDWIQDAELDLAKKFTEQTGFKLIIKSYRRINTTTC